MRNFFPFWLDADFFILNQFIWYMAREIRTCVVYTMEDATVRNCFEWERSVLKQ